MKSWNEIRKAATAFSKRWKDAYDDKSQAQSSLKEFFAVFGVDSDTFGYNDRSEVTSATICGIANGYGYDNIGNVTRYLDENGNTVAQYTYDAFGKLIAKSGPLADLFRHRFSTKYLNADSPRWNQRYRRYRNSGIDKEDMNTFVIKEDNMQNIHLILQLLNGSSR